jgi:hypothetical protein
VSYLARSWFPSSETSASTTFAPSRAKANALASHAVGCRVTNATLSVEDAFLFIVVAVCVVGYLTSSMVASNRAGTHSERLRPHRSCRE